LNRRGFDDSGAEFPPVARGRPGNIAPAAA